MFPKMQTRILNIRASQSNGTISFSGVFTGYSNAEQTSVSLNVDPRFLEESKADTHENTAYDDYEALVLRTIDTDALTG